MKIQLKNLKYSDFASHETHCFEATIYIDGVKKGTADNDGRGGMTNINPWQLEKEIKRFTDTLPPEIRHYGGETMTFEVTPDGYINDLVTITLHEKDLKRGLKNKILFARDGKIYETKRLTAAEMTASFLDPKIKEKLKTEQILNLMQFDQALKLYMEFTK